MLEWAGLRKHPNARVLVVGGRPYVKDVLLHHSFRNTVNAIYFAIQPDTSITTNTARPSNPNHIYQGCSILRYAFFKEGSLACLANDMKLIINNSTAGHTHTSSTQHCQRWSREQAWTTNYETRDGETREVVNGRGCLYEQHELIYICARDIDGIFKKLL